MRGGWAIRLCAMLVIAGVVAMQSLVGVHLGPQFSTAGQVTGHVTGDVAGHVTGAAADQAAMSDASTGTHETDCTSSGCGSTTAAVMCVALLTMLLLATVRRSGRVWAAPTWESGLTQAARIGRRSECRRTPAPMQLGISRT